MNLDPSLTLAPGRFARTLHWEVVQEQQTGRLPLLTLDYFCSVLTSFSSSTPRGFRRGSGRFFAGGTVSKAWGWELLSPLGLDAAGPVGWCISQSSVFQRCFKISFSSSCFFIVNLLWMRGKFRVNYLTQQRRLNNDLRIHRREAHA